MYWNACSTHLEFVVDIVFCIATENIVLINYIWNGDAAGGGGWVDGAQLKEHERTKRIIIHSAAVLCYVFVRWRDDTHVLYNINHIHIMMNMWELWIYAMARSFEQRVTAGAIVFGEYIWISVMCLYRYFSMFLCAIWASNRLVATTRKLNKKNGSQTELLYYARVLWHTTVVIEKIEKKSYLKFKRFLHFNCEFCALSVFNYPRLFLKIWKMFFFCLFF